MPIREFHVPIAKQSRILDLVIVRSTNEIGTNDANREYSHVPVRIAEGGLFAYVYSQFVD